MCLIALTMLVAPKAKADPLNQKTIVTFSGPVQVPGVGQHLLPAGTYVFKLMDSASNRNIVQIWNEREDHVYTTILAIPNYRMTAAGETVITFHERPAGSPEALKAWFYPGREWGQEFVYDREEAIKLAQEVNEPVLATSVAQAEAPVEALSTEPVEAVAPTGETMDLAQVVGDPPMAAPEPAAAEAPVEVAQTLPQTASDLPLIGLAGLLMLGSGLALFGFLKLNS